MIKQIYLLLGIFCLLSVSIQGADLIPYPVRLIRGQGEFVLSDDTKLSYDEALASRIPVCREILNNRLGFSLKQKEAKGNSTITLHVDPNLKLPKEGYRLEVTPRQANITASSPEGVFYGVQTLAQLLRPDIREQKGYVPSIKIEDYPRFKWRGCMLDVSRTFMDVRLLKRYINLMAGYKLNVLHLHLTDDQGWRLEIKRYPRLTSVGSQFDAEYNEMGGYYTQEEMKDLIRYAAERNITIVPEIEIQGHSCAAIVAYPQLACYGVHPKIHPYDKGPGIHTEIFCAGKKDVYEFIFNVLDEVTEIFPSEYIHIGGDEAPKTAWKKCPDCQRMIKENALADEEELQSLLVQKLGCYLKQKGRKLIGWDEITEGGKLKGDETVMYWRSGVDGVSGVGKRMAEYAERGFQIISTPGAYCYFDHDYRRIDTRKTYLYEPIPTGISEKAAQKYIGIQASFWSHLDRCESRIDRQLFPRLFALSELAWTSSAQKDWKRFRKTAREHVEWLREMGVNCYDDRSLYSSELDE